MPRAGFEIHKTRSFNGTRGASKPEAPFVRNADANCAPSQQRPGQNGTAAASATRSGKPNSTSKASVRAPFLGRFQEAISESLRFSLFFGVSPGACTRHDFFLKPFKTHVVPRPTFSLFSLFRGPSLVRISHHDQEQRRNSSRFAYFLRFGRQGLIFASVAAHV